MDKHLRPQSQSVEWLTPPEIVEALGPFDLDPCAPIKRPWDTARRHYTVEDDGLAQPWSGKVWLNPPWGRGADMWLAKLAAHNHGIALVPARTETHLFFRHVWPLAGGICFMAGRPHFHRKDGTRAKHNCGCAVALLAYGIHCSARLLDADLGETIILNRGGGWLPRSTKGT